ncbi:glycosyltransferase family 9 protein [Bradyrhizobium elkanii]
MSDDLRNGRAPLIFFANGIGDGVLVTPALRAVHRSFHGRARFVFQDGPDRFLFNEYGRAETGFVNTNLNAQRDGRDFPVDVLREHIKGCDLFLCFAEWISESLIELKDSCAPKVSVGFFPDFDICVPRTPTLHQFDVMFSIPQTAFPELEIEKFSIPLTFSSEVKGAGDDILSALGSRTCIALHPESSITDKSYSDQSLRVLIRHLLESTEATICVFGQRDAYSSLESESCRIVVFNYLPLELASYLISKMSLFVGVDSCFLHIADLCRVPTVGLFGPTDPAIWGCRFAPHTHIRAQAVNEIDKSDVTEAVRSLADRCQIPI